MKVLISGAAGFIGAHAAARFLKSGATVIGLDNLSRRGCTDNLAWLRGLPGDFRFAHADLRHEDDLDRAFAQANLESGGEPISTVIHLGGQVAVTTSVTHPRLDFEGNALGTLNMLEAARKHCPDAAFLYASTNKVYGGLEHIEVCQRNGRYEYAEHPEGVDENEPLDFHSPYGCSKGAADQYVRDYARIYKLKTVVFRQSCIYGERQFGVEDQGWVAWFTIATLLHKPMTVYGDGMQIRDLLWVEDLISLYQRAIERIDVAAGKIYNAGGGPRNTLSLLELIAMLRVKTDIDVRPAYSDWRPGDQRVFVANIAKARQELGWAPEVSVQDGVNRLIEWTDRSKSHIESIFGRK
ncbi:MAG TPA: GDP-mannose 4,6-dehydratase [Chthonomonadaceae bacterium]|nr:GDP-mannose 4,6-dehydratase [Chthonomonadaceae bacterium]